MSDHYLKTELYEMLRSDPQIFEFLERGSLDGVWYWDIEKPEHEWLSPRFNEVFGFAPDELPHSPEWWQANIHPDDLALALANYEAHCADPSHPYDQVVRYRHRDGSTVWVRCRGLAIRDASGRPIRMLGAHNEITDLKRTEREVRQLNRNLEEHVQSRTQELHEALDAVQSFNHSVSHDLRTPVRAVAGFATLLEKRVGDELDEKSKSYLRRIVEGSRALTEMIDGLSELSRLSSSSLDRKTVSVAKAVESAVEELRMLEPDREVSVLNGGHESVLADPKQLALLVRNLLSNAWKFTAESPNARVEIGWEEQDGEVVHFVRDDGIGFEPAHAKNIFAPFARAHESSRVPGTGLGLATVWRVVQRHGGTIEAEGRPDEGATFRFTLQPKAGRP